MKLESKRLFHGPSPFSSRPVVVATLDAPEVTPAQATEVAKRMEGVFSNWFSSHIETHQDAELYIGQFLASWSLAALNYRRGYVQEAGAKYVGDTVHLWLEYHHPQVAINCLETASRLFQGIGMGQLSADQVRSALQNLLVQCARHHPDYQARILMIAARDRDIPYLQHQPGTKFWQFGWGVNSTTFFETRSSKEPHFGIEMAGDKSLAKRIMMMLGVPVVQHVLVRSEGDLAAAADKVGWPCVVKPLDASMAKGVTTDLRNLEELTAAFTAARQHTQGPIMVESHVPGDVHRLLVVRGKLAVAMRRQSPFVIADGRSSVRELVQQLNEGRPNKGNSVGRQGRVPEDEEYRVTLAKQELTPESVPESGRKVILRRIPFQYVGGVNTNVTAQAHPDVKVMAETLSVSLGIDIAGLDYVTEDIGQSFHQGGAVVEINLNPDLPPLVDHNNDESALGSMVLGDEPGRIPLHLLLLQEDAVEAFSDQLNLGEGWGWVCNGKIGVGTTTLTMPPAPMTVATMNLLKNRTVQQALVIATLAQLLEYGLPVDRVDRVLMQERSIPEDWATVLQRHSAEITSIATVNDAAAALGL